MLWVELLPTIDIKAQDDKEAIEWATEIIKSVFYGTGIDSVELIKHFCLLVQFRKEGRLPAELLEKKAE